MKPISVQSFGGQRPSLLSGFTILVKYAVVYKNEMHKKEEKTRVQCKKFIEAYLEDERNTFPGLKQKLEKRRFIAICQWLHLDAEDKQGKLNGSSRYIEIQLGSWSRHWSRHWRQNLCKNFTSLSVYTFVRDVFWQVARNLICSKLTNFYILAILCFSR